MLPQIPQDKANHFIYGFVIYILATLIFSNLISLGILLIVAVGKEAYDSKHNGSVEALDVVATLLPAFILFIKELIF